MSPELHPLCTLFPRMAGSEFALLRDDIKVNGLREPIVLHDGMILDGGNRYRACVDAGITPQFVQFSGGSIVSFVLSANLHRRHMTPGQQAAIVAAAQDWASAQGRGGDRGNQHGGPRQSATLHFASVEQRAAESGASVRTQKMADKVAKADPGLVRRVAQGEVTLPKAVEQIEGKKPAKADKSADRVAELEAALAEAQDAAAEAGALAQDLLAQVNGEADKRLEQMRAELAAVKATRDIALRENAQLKRMVKALQRKLGEAQ